MDLERIESLIAKTALADQIAFGELYDAVSAKLFGVCLRVLKDRAEAEEVLQEVFVKIWQKADRYAANGLSPMSWLIALARNASIDRLRARKVVGREVGEGLDGALEVADSAPSPEAAAVATSEKERLDGCLRELESERATAVRGAYLEGETYQDLAERHNVPVNTMRTWLRRSLIKLRECLTR